MNSPTAQHISEQKRKKQGTNKRWNRTKAQPTLSPSSDAREAQHRVFNTGMNSFTKKIRKLWRKKCEEWQADVKLCSQIETLLIRIVNCCLIGTWQKEKRTHRQWMALRPGSRTTTTKAKRTLHCFPLFRFFYIIWSSFIVRCCWRCCCCCQPVSLYSCCYFIKCSAFPLLISFFSFAFTKSFSEGIYVMNVKLLQQKYNNNTTTEERIYPWNSLSKTVVIIRRWCIISDRIGSRLHWSASKSKTKQNCFSLSSFLQSSKFHISLLAHEIFFRVRLTSPTVCL